MRLLFAFVFAFICSCSYTTSTVNLNDEKEVTRSLVGSWESTHFETSNSRIEVPKEMKNIVTYAADGTFESKKKDGMMKTTGKWHYDAKTQMINESANGQGTSVPIKQLTKNQLSLGGYTMFNNQVIDSNISTFRKL